MAMSRHVRILVINRVIFSLEVGQQARQPWQNEGFWRIMRRFAAIPTTVTTSTVGVSPVTLQTVGKHSIQHITHEMEQA